MAEQEAAAVLLRQRSRCQSAGVTSLNVVPEKAKGDLRPKIGRGDIRPLLQEQASIP